MIFYIWTTKFDVLVSVSDIAILTRHVFEKELCPEYLYLNTGKSRYNAVQ